MTLDGEDEQLSRAATLLEKNRVAPAVSFICGSLSSFITCADRAPPPPARFQPATFREDSTRMPCTPMLGSMPAPVLGGASSLTAIFETGTSAGLQEALSPLTEPAAAARNSSVHRGVHGVMVSSAWTACIRCKKARTWFFPSSGGLVSHTVATGGSHCRNRLFWDARVQGCALEKRSPCTTNKKPSTEKHAYCTHTRTHNGSSVQEAEHSNLIQEHPWTMKLIFRPRRHRAPGDPDPRL